MVICNQVNVRCYVDIQGRIIFIMYHVLECLNCSLTKSQQFIIETVAWKNIHWFSTVFFFNGWNYYIVYFTQCFLDHPRVPRSRVRFWFLNRQLAYSMIAFLGSFAMMILPPPLLFKCWWLSKMAQSHCSWTKPPHSYFVKSSHHNCLYMTPGSLPWCGQLNPEIH